MPTPRLIHPVRCVIRQSRTNLTAYDDDAREPIQQVARDAEVAIQGQPSFKPANFGTEVAQYTPGGLQVTGQSYILFRYIDLNARSITLRIGDRIVQIGHLAVDMYIERLTPTGHYPETNGASLLKAFLADRKPARNSPGEVG